MSCLQTQKQHSPSSLPPSHFRDPYQRAGGGAAALCPVDPPVPRHQLGVRSPSATSRSPNPRHCRVEAALCVRPSSRIQRMINEDDVASGQGPASHSNHRDLSSAISSLCRICCSQVPREGQRSLSRGKAATCAGLQGSTGPCLGLGRGEDPGRQPVAGCLHLVRAGDSMPSLTKQCPGMLLSHQWPSTLLYGTPSRSR